MNIAFFSLYVLGTQGAIAAETYIREASKQDKIDRVFVFDAPKNKRKIEGFDSVFLKLRNDKKNFNRILNAIRVFKLIKRNQIKVLHFFYRLNNIPTISLAKILCILFNVKCTFICDHRSVNLSPTPNRRKALNLLLFPIDIYAGNINAVKTNHFFHYSNKKKEAKIFDLGWNDFLFNKINKKLPFYYQKSLPLYGDRNIKSEDRIVIWYVGTLSKANRDPLFIPKTLEILSQILGDSDYIFKIAGPCSKEVRNYLKKIKKVKILGKISQRSLYERMYSDRHKNSIGLAYMALRHQMAPSLKMVEYALTGFKIVASDTIGMRQQAERFGVEVGAFTRNTPELFADSIIKLINQKKVPNWGRSEDYAYSRLFKDQVLPVYLENDK